jgi:dihydrofolate synthase/folylpolyglutamate synthase
MQFLGDTLPEIAGEKAGIIKTNIPVVIGETHPETKPVFLQKAAEVQAPITFADQHWRAELTNTDLLETIFDVFQNEELRYANLRVNVYGDYQTKNVQTVLQAVELLREPFGLTDGNIRYALEHLRALTRYIGRWQLLGERPTILCDSAHNEEGLRLAMQQLQKIPYHNLHIVFGVVQDKDIATMLAILPRKARYYFAKANVPRGLDAQQLREKANALGLQGRAYVSVKNALRAAKRRAANDDLIFVGGSVFVVAEVV